MDLLAATGWVLLSSVCRSAFSDVPFGCRIQHNIYSPHTLACTAGHYIFPDTFEVEAIPLNVTGLEIKHRNKGHVLKPSFAPVPLRVNLTHVWLVGFLQDNGEPFPVERFLVNVKHNVRGLTFNRGYLPYLRRETLSGFSSLESLVIIDAKMVHLAADAFTELRTLSQTSRLHGFLSSKNNVTLVNWQVFKPVASSMQSIGFIGDNVHQIQAGDVFHFKALSHLNLQDNQLTSLSQALLRTLNRNTLRGFSLSGNPTCREDSLCRCCETLSLVSWLRWSPTTRDASFDCGLGPPCNSRDEVNCTQRYKAYIIPSLMDHNYDEVQQCSITDGGIFGWSTTSTGPSEMTTVNTAPTQQTESTSDSAGANSSSEGQSPIAEATKSSTASSVTKFPDVPCSTFFGLALTFALRPYDQQ